MSDFSKAEIITLNFELRGKPVSLEYDAAKYTGDRQDKWYSANGGDTQLILDLVSKWDVQAEGEIVALEAEAIRKLPVWAYAGVARAIVEDVEKLAKPTLTA